MKTKLLASLILINLLPFSGCSIFKAPTSETQAQRIERIGAIAEIAAYTGTALRLADHPEDRPKFRAASSALSAVGGDAAALHTALSSLPIKELQGEKGAIIIGVAVLLYETELKRLTPVDQASAVVVVSKKIKAGIDRALEQVRP